MTCVRRTGINGLRFGCVAGAMLLAGACDDNKSKATDSGTDLMSASTGGRGGAGGGGRGGSGVDAGPVCITAQYTHVSTFTSIFDGWVVANVSTPTLVPMPGAGPDGGFSGTVVELDTTVGSPALGSAKLTIPFDDANQSMVFAQNFSVGVNMSGTNLSARIKVDSGLITGPTDVARAYLVVKTTNLYNYAPGTSVNLEPGADWVTLSLNADAPSPTPPTGYNPCDVREIDLIVETGMGGTFRSAIIHIDTIAITSRTGSDAGSGGEDAATN